MVAAGVDIGTNTILMVIANVNEHGSITVLADAHEIPRLGEGLAEHGGITKDAVHRASAVLSSYRQMLHAHGNPQVTAVATEAIRTASNADKVRRQLEHALACPIHVLSGKQEAVLTFAGTTAGVFGPSTVIDIGGGSTELVHGMEGRASWAVSLPLGSVRLTEQFITNRPVDAATQKKLHEHIETVFGAAAIPHPFASSGSLIAVAGTATSLAHLDAGLHSFDIAVVDGYSLQEEQLGFWEQELFNKDLHELQALPGIDIRRADVLPAGVAILKSITQLLGSPNIKVSVKGLRYGALLNSAGLI